MSSGRPVAFIKIQSIREAQERKDLKNRIWKGWSEFKIPISPPTNFMTNYLTPTNFPHHGESEYWHFIVRITWGYVIKGGINRVQCRGQNHSRYSKAMTPLRHCSARMRVLTALGFFPLLSLDPEVGSCLCYHLSHNCQPNCLSQPQPRNKTLSGFSQQIFSLLGLQRKWIS